MALPDTARTREPRSGRAVAALARVPGWAWLAIALVVQVAIIGSLVATHYATAATGKPVFLKIAPVDPRDPLRGDYLSFTYDISYIEAERFAEPPKKGQALYVPLSREGGPFWVVTGGSVPTGLPKPAPDGSYPDYPPDVVFLRGVVQDPAAIEPRTSATRVHIVYGIEEYFVPEGKAATFPVFSKEAVGKVLVDKDGKGLLQQVYVGGVKWP